MINTAGQSEVNQIHNTSASFGVASAVGSKIPPDNATHALKSKSAKNPTGQKRSHPSDIPRV
jgi:hypothetical protein